MHTYSLPTLHSSLASKIQKISEVVVASLSIPMTLEQPNPSHILLAIAVTISLYVSSFEMAAVSVQNFASQTHDIFRMCLVSQNNLITASNSINHHRSTPNPS